MRCTMGDGRWAMETMRCANECDKGPRNVREERASERKQHMNVER